MSFSKIAVLSGLLASASTVAAHGYVQGIVADGTYYSGYIVTQFPYESNPPAVIGWATTAKDLGFVDGTGYASSDIICHKNATPGAATATVAAGGTVELQWTDWPTSHHGPVINYLANCNGNCSSVDKTTLEFFKFEASGLIDDTDVPGTWASDNLISKNNSWTVTIPTTIEPGDYVLRHEIIALHSAGNTNGAQNYPQCINLKITGSGTDSPAGTLGTALYKDTDPGILVNIYQSLSSYEIPGPSLYTSGSGSTATTTAATSTTATVIPTPSAVAVSIPVVSSPAKLLSSPASVLPASTSSPAEVTLTATETDIATATAIATVTGSPFSVPSSQVAIPSVSTFVTSPTVGSVRPLTSSAVSAPPDAPVPSKSASATSTPVSVLITTDSTPSSSGSPTVSSGTTPSASTVPLPSGVSADQTVGSMLVKDFMTLLKNSFSSLVVHKKHARAFSP